VLLLFFFIKGTATATTTPFDWTKGLEKKS
jgi:hypothetical protein